MPEKIMKIECAGEGYYGLRQNCMMPTQVRGQNYWGNLSHQGGKGPAGIVALKAPAIAEISQLGGNFTTIPGYKIGASWTNGTGYIGHVQFKSVSAAIAYLKTYFDLCLCNEETMTSLEENGSIGLQICRCQ